MTLQRNAIANLAGRAATAVLWLAITPYAFSKLGPERFGVWSLFFAFNAYLISLDLGIGSTMLRFIAAQRPAGGRQALVRTVRWGVSVALGLGLVWMVFVLVARGWIAQAFHIPAPMQAEALEALLIFGFGVLLMLPAQTLMASLKGFERLDLSNVSQVLGVAAHALGLYLGLSAGMGLRGAALAGVAAQAVSAVASLFMLWRELHKLTPGSGAGPVWRDLAQFSAALQLLSALIVLQFEAGRMVLGLLGNLAMLADYELAYRVSFAAFTIPILVREPVIPVVSRVGESEGLGAVTSLFTSTSRWVYINTVIVLGLLWVLAPDIVRVWLGPGHERIAGLIRLWAVAFSVNLAYSPGVAIARGMAMPRFEIWSYLAAVVTNVALAVAWVPRHGAAGAIVASAFSNGVGFLVFVAAFHRGSRIPFGPWFRKELAPRALAGLLTVALGAELLALGRLGGHLPASSLGHGALATLVFLTLFALFFLPLGDTQRLSRMLWQMSTGVWARRRATRSS